MNASIALKTQEFDAIRQFAYREAGISLTPEKRALVSGRLEKRLRTLELASYSDYLRLVTNGDGEEKRIAIDLLTTNETYFFREPKHFDFLRDWVRSNDRPGRAWRVWCGASSTGEEPYSIAMTLADSLGVPRWEVLGTDISTRVLDTARRAIYPMRRLEAFPAAYLRRFCLKGTGPEEGNMAIDRSVRAQVSFMRLNLNEPLPDLGSFDVIFLRNVLIYFDADTKRRVIERVCRHLADDGCFIVSHSESLHGLAAHLTQRGPSIYRKAS